MRRLNHKWIWPLVAVLLLGAPVRAADAPAPDGLPAYDAELTNYAYPFPVRFFEVTAQQQKLRMAYMELAPVQTENAPVIVLLHGKNFGGYAFDKVAPRLLAMGYRVVMPDQIGFGKSSKPARFQYSFQALAALTDELLASRGIKRYMVLGHSMGGMLATRLALMYPDKVERLILVNPLGLEDWKLLTPYKSIDALYADELKQTPEKIKAYQQGTYYNGAWRPEYDRYIEAASGWTRHADYPRIAWHSALTYDMIFTQPVLYEFKNLKTPTALIIGQTDTTAPGKAWAPEENKKKMGHYPELGRAAQRMIPGARLFELAGLGHAPFIQDIERFFKEGLEPALYGLNPAQQYRHIARDGTVQLHAGNLLGDSQLASRLLAQEIWADRVSRQFRVTWSFGAFSGMGGYTALYNRDMATLKLFGKWGELNRVYTRHENYANVTDEGLLQLADKFRTGKRPDGSDDTDDFGYFGRVTRFGATPLPVART